MSQQTVVKRSAAAATANTDTVIMTPPGGTRLKLLAFMVTNEGAAQAAGMAFELRFGSNIIALVGFDVAAAPIGQSSKEVVLAHEIIGDGLTAVNGRNLTTLAASSTAGYVISYDVGY